MTKRALLLAIATTLSIATAGWPAPAWEAATRTGGAPTKTGSAGGASGAGEGLLLEFREDFDSYANGSSMHGQGGWKGWQNDPALTAPVTDAFSSTAPHSVEITGAADLVHELSGYDHGQWIVSARVRVGSGTGAGLAYFILLNTYSDAGPPNASNWSTQIAFDVVGGVVVSDNGGPSLPLITDAWVEIRVEIDLDADTQDIYYDGALLESKSWTEGIAAGGALNIAAVDLFSNAASEVYFDEIWLRRAPTPETGHLSVPATDFLPRNAADGYLGDEAGTMRAFDLGSRMFAPVQLPHGATVTSLRCGARAIPTDYRLVFTLRRNQPQVANVDLAEVATTLPGTGLEHPVTDAIVSPVIDNESFNYYLVAVVEQDPDVGGLCETDCEIRYCRIGYVGDGP